MTNEKLYEMLGDIGETYIVEAEHGNKRSIRIKWGSMVAGLCLLAGIALSGSMSQMGNGEREELVELDPIVADMAVFPADESLANVEDVVTKSLSEKEAQQVEKLGAYVPTSVPEGYAFDYASLYKTTMKDGTEYIRLNIGYAFVADDPDLFFEEEVLVSGFSAAVMNYEPETEYSVYTLDELPETFETGESFVLKTDDVYMEMIAGELTGEQIKLVLDSVK